MKKNIFSWLTIALMAIVCVGFAACGSDDDGGKSAYVSDSDDDNSSVGSTSDLVGIWKRVYKKETNYQKNSSGQWEQDGDPKVTTYDNVSAHGYHFNADKTAKSIYIRPDGTITPETRDDLYKVENGQLYLLELDDRDTDGWESHGYIKFIDNNEFELTEEDIDGSRREIEVKRYRKINIAGIDGKFVNTSYAFWCYSKSDKRWLLDFCNVDIRSLNAGNFPSSGLSVVSIDFEGEEGSEVPTGEFDDFNVYFVYGLRPNSEGNQMEKPRDKEGKLVITKSGNNYTVSYTGVSLSNDKKTITNTSFSYTGPLTYYDNVK